MKNIVKGLERFAKHKNPAEITEKLVPTLMLDYDYPPHLQEQYVQRLRHGLHQYYTRRYRPADDDNQPKPPSENDA